MLSDAASLAQLAQAAPWLAVGLLSMLAAAWVYRQSRRAVKAAEDRCQASARRQGERLGQIEHLTGLLDLRRRQVEWVLTGDGLNLPYWPADGPQQPHPRRVSDFAPDDEDQADELGPETIQRRIPVPPLDLGVAARHRRPAEL